MLGVALAAGACQRQAKEQGTAPVVSSLQEIAWREGDIDDAFAEAKERNKPVLLYWGAKWCPPCNLMKQTLFKDPAFIAETRGFIPVHLDGDTKGAQVWGEKFGISGYPTVILLRPDRSEITRLSSGSAASSLAQVLHLAATRTMSTEELLKRAADAPTSLSAGDWRLLAAYDWMDDPKHFGVPANGAAVLARLGDAAPDAAMRRHFALTGLVMGGDGSDVAKLSAAQKARVAAILPPMLADYAEVKANRQELSYAGASLILALPAADRRALAGRLVAALDRLAADPGTPLGDRLATLNTDIALSKADNRGKAAPEVLAKVRQRVAMVDRAAGDPMMRQAVMPSAGDLLAEAGDETGATRLLTAELPHAVAPYYFMIDLSDLAEKRKDTKAAVEWARKAAESADGAATRIQWAIMYSETVLRLTPQDAAAVEHSAASVINALGANTSGYAQRTEKKVGEWGKKLEEWSKAHGGAPMLGRLAARMDQMCAKGDPQSRCRNVLKA